MTGKGTQQGASRDAWLRGPGSSPDTPDPDPPSSWKYWRPKEEARADGFPPRRLPYGGGAWCSSCLIGVVVAAVYSVRGTLTSPAVSEGTLGHTLGLNHTEHNITVTGRFSSRRILDTNTTRDAIQSTLTAEALERRQEWRREQCACSPPTNHTSVSVRRPALHRSSYSRALRSLETPDHPPRNNSPTSSLSRERNGSQSRVSLQWVIITRLAMTVRPDVCQCGLTTHQSPVSHYLTLLTTVSLSHLLVVL